MSFDALAWAARQNTGSAGTKLVLLGLAECAHRETAEAYPSIAALVEFSSMDRKSVIANLNRLEAGGFITDSGKREGRTKQVKVYRLALYTVPISEQSQNRNSSDIPSKQSQKRDTDTVKEPVSGKAKASPQRAKGKFPAPDGVGSEQWLAFCQQRKKPLSAYAYTLLTNKLRDLAEDGFPPGPLIDLAITRGWETVFKPRDQRNDRPQQPASRNSAAVEYSLRGLDPHATF